MIQTKSRSCGHGFSVIELIAVVVVIAIIVALTIPEFRRRQAAAATQELPEAVAAGDFRRVATLLKRGADVDTVRGPIEGRPDIAASMSHSMLSLAIRLRHPDVARLLLRHGADPNGDVPGNKYQPLFWAAYTFDEGLFDALIEAGADIDFKLNGKTAYQIAELPYDNVARFLKEKGAATE